MANTVMNRRSLKVTVPANTDEHTLTFDYVLRKGDQNGHAFIEMISGTAVQFDEYGVTIDSSSLTLASSGNNVKAILDITRGTPIKYKGGAGSEVFNITIHSQ